MIHHMLSRLAAVPLGIGNAQHGPFAQYRWEREGN